jgi:hypothetical protein
MEQSTKDRPVTLEEAISIASMAEQVVNAFIGTDYVLALVIGDLNQFADVIYEIKRRLDAQ